MNTLTQILKIVILLFVLLVFLIYFFQRNLIYFPSPNTPSPKDFDASDLSVLQLHTKDNLTLNAWYKSAQAHQPVSVTLFL